MEYNKLDEMVNDLNEDIFKKETFCIDFGVIECKGDEPQYVMDSSEEEDLYFAKKRKFAEAKKIKKFKRMKIAPKVEGKTTKGNTKGEQSKKIKEAEQNDRKMICSVAKVQINNKNGDQNAKVNSTDDYGNLSLGISPVIRVQKKINKNLFESNTSY